MEPDVGKGGPTELISARPVDDCQLPLCRINELKKMQKSQEPRVPRADKCLLGVSRSQSGGASSGVVEKLLLLCEKRKN